MLKQGTNFMINTITLSVPDEEMAASLVGCKAGEEKTVTFTVTEVRKGMLSGDVTEIEGYESDEGEEPESEESDEIPQEKTGKEKLGKMPKAIVLIGAGK